MSKSTTPFGAHIASKPENVVSVELQYSAILQHNINWKNTNMGETRTTGQKWTEDTDY